MINQAREALRARAHEALALADSMLHSGERPVGHAEEVIHGALRALAAIPAPDTGAEERLRAALREWMDATGDDGATEGRLIDAAREWLAPSGGSVDEEGDKDE